MTDEAEHKTRRDLTATTTRLIEFLRDLAGQGSQRRASALRQVQILWLADLPSDITLTTEAGFGDVLLSCEPYPALPHPKPPDILLEWLDHAGCKDSSLNAPPFLEASGIRPPPEQAISEEPDSRSGSEPPPDVLQAYRSWLPVWRQWAANDRNGSSRRDWFHQLTSLAHRLSQQDDEYELILGTGLLTYTLPPSNQTVARHLLSTRLKVVTDRNTGRVDLLIDPDAATRLEDQDLPHQVEGPSSAAKNGFTEQLRMLPPLSNEVSELLERWQTLRLPYARPFMHAWQRPSDITDIPEMCLAPALILQKRDRSRLIEYYDRMLQALNQPGANAPLGLAQLVTTLEREQRLKWLQEQTKDASSVGLDPLFPLPANPEQRQIIERLATDNGVVVHGPPGTGKTHTIANLISALLAQGLRVLVTSEKSQALRVLVDKLPSEIQELCVLMTEQKRGELAELTKSVNALSGRSSTHDPIRHASNIEALATHRLHVATTVADIKERIRALRATEIYEHLPVAPGYKGTLGEIADKVRGSQHLHGWMPLPLPGGSPDEAPLTISEAIELHQLLRSATPSRLARMRQWLPSVDSFPGPSIVHRLIEDEYSASAEAASATTPLSSRLDSLNEGVLDRLEHAVEEASAGLQALRLSSDPDMWDEQDWRTRALKDALSRREQGLWQQIALVASQAHDLKERLTSLGLTSITIPTSVSPNPQNLQILQTASEFRNYLSSGGKIRTRFKSRIQKRAESLLLEIKVDGVSPTTIEALDALLVRLDAEIKSRALEEKWALVGATVDTTAPVERRIAQLEDLATAMLHLGKVVAHRDEVGRMLLEANIRIPLDTAKEWYLFTKELSTVRIRFKAARARSELNALTAQLRNSDNYELPPELEAAAQAIQEGDHEAYDEAFRQFAHAHVEHGLQARCQDLLARVHAFHPDLARHLERVPHDDIWLSRLSSLPEAWAWAKAHTFLVAQRQPGREQELDTQLQEAVEQLRQATKKLAAEQAWSHCLNRMTPKQAAALRAYQGHILDLGAGKGRYADRYRRAARESMQEARDAVPAWVMPLSEIVESIPPDPDSFDVVIVDEASQAGIERLFLLWLAPRVIVVGDDKQCTPSAIAHGELNPIFERLDDRLPDIPEYLRTSLTPRSSLFSLLKTRFGSVIQLREHFRCMPEIITWSSREFYEASPLIPLRQFGADRLAPLQVTHVSGAVSEGTGPLIRNEVEARLLVDAMASCLKDRAYDDKTFGVVVLQGGQGQVGLIESLIQERIPPDEQEKRKIRVGIAANFQGDERNVIFLSMVVAHKTKAMTDTNAKRRFNVAATRAQDQLWLFHSVTLDMLSPVDLRSSLLSYMSQPPSPFAQEALNVNDHDLKEPFESLLQQKIYLRLQERGYHVIPQYEINDRSIDLVVSGARGRLAIECDGRYWHDSPDEQMADIDREQELKRARWQFWRVRESDFNFDPDGTLLPLWSMLDRLQIFPQDVPMSRKEQAVDWVPLRLSDEDDFTSVEENE